MLTADRPDPEAPRISATRLARSRTAWLLTILFAAQSFQAYIAFGWFADFMHRHGVSSASAGAMVAVLAAASIPASMIAPSLTQNHARRVVVVLSGLGLIAYVGLSVAPVGGAWAWMILAGAAGGMFPVTLTMIGLRARTPETTGALSAFVQAIGYITAGTGPLLVGVFLGVTGGWGLPLGLLYAALAVGFLAGWRVSRPSYVEDEIAVPAR
jgi:CP family cyanate transporter-like MFS transporter